VEVGVEAHVDLWPTLVDPNQLENALLNLVINARDAMPKGGQLTISISNCTLEGVAGEAGEIEPGDYVALSVSDTGTGMSPEVMARAFDPFFTTKPLGAGTGLGLSMIYGFARQSGGEVRIKSRTPGGTRVTIYLPRFDGELTDLGQERETPAEPSLGTARLGETVLVVDDEAGVRMLVSDIVRELGFEPLSAGTAAEGLDIIRSDARVDLLVSDVGLPGGMDGREMVDVARGLRPELKVLFITGFAEQAVIGAEQRDAGMAVMTKPFQMDALGTRIRELLQS
jgi:CheY-like chemotaxis protein